MMKLSLISTRLDLINALILPLIMKLEAVRQTALVKVQQRTGLNTHTAQDITFYTKQEGGRLGVPSFEWTHFATRLSRLINMLNSDGQQVMY